jgi:hypothetical protein
MITVARSHTNKSAKVIARNIYLFLFVLSACSGADRYAEDSLINTLHLEHLYQEVEINDSTHLGTVWIYSNAPDYPLVNDQDEGFTCVDDVSRAMVFYCRQYDKNPVADNLNMIESLTEFIIYMQADNGYCYNFMFPDNGINRIHPNSRPVPNFWSWRAFWALTELNLLDAPELDELKDRSRSCMEKLLKNMDDIFSSESHTIEFEGIRIPAVIAEQGADQVALIMIGLCNYYQKNNTSSIKDLLLKLGHHLLAVQYGDGHTFPYFAFLSWKNIWHAWGNMQAYALLYAGRILQEEQFIHAGLKEVKHFYPFCVDQQFISDFRLIRDNDSLRATDFHRFPQISYGIRPMVFASMEAFNITGDEAYARLAGELASWYFGNNPANQVMYDQHSGRTFDGINSASRTNYNSGAESTIETLLSIQAMESNPVAKKIIREYSIDPISLLSGYKSNSFNWL